MNDQPEPEKVKTCFTCKKELSEDYFYDCKDSSDGMSSSCRLCHRAYMRAWQEKRNNKFRKDRKIVNSKYRSREEALKRLEEANEASD